MHRLAVILLVVNALGPQMPVARLGDVASRLTIADIAELERVDAGGHRPWLIVTEAGKMTPGWLATVFLEPTVVQPRLRRGETRRLTKLAGGSTLEGGWRADSSAGWAWVAITGREFDDVVDDDDVNRPFEVFGEWADEEIVTLADFLRTAPQVKPENPGAPAHQAGAPGRAQVRAGDAGVRPGSRILALRRERGFTGIYLHAEGERDRGQSVSVERVNGEWQLRSVGWFIIG